MGKQINSWMSSSDNGSHNFFSRWLHVVSRGLEEFDSGFQGNTEIPYFFTHEALAEILHKHLLKNGASCLSSLHMRLLGKFGEGSGYCWFSLLRTAHLLTKNGALERVQGESKNRFVYRATGRYVDYLSLH